MSRLKCARQDCCWLLLIKPLLSADKAPQPRDNMQDQPARPEAPAPVDSPPTHRPSLERRLDALERENRFFRLALLAALFLMPAGALAAAQSIGALSGTEVEVKDQSGQVRARLEPQGLFLYDKRGKLRASLSVPDYETPTLGLLDEAGKMRLMVSLLHPYLPDDYVCGRKGCC